MEPIWEKLYDAARAVQNDRRISQYIEAGCVAAAVLSGSGRIYTGVCVDTLLNARYMRGAKRDIQHDNQR